MAGKKNVHPKPNMTNASLSIQSYVTNPRSLFHVLVSFHTVGRLVKKCGRKWNHQFTFFQLRQTTTPLPLTSMRLTGGYVYTYIHTTANEYEEFLEQNRSHSPRAVWFVFGPAKRHELLNPNEACLALLCTSYWCCTDILLHISTDSMQMPWSLL